MKKLFLTALAILAFASFALAANYPAINPNSDPQPALTIVYNNSTSSLNVGETVCWDADASTDDDKNYVTSTCSGISNNVAGVVHPVIIPAYGSGTIAIFGIVDDVELEYDIGADTPICASSTATKAVYCDDGGDLIGITTEASTSKLAKSLILVAPAASSIARANDPKNAAEIWTLPVYANAAVTAGDVVVWGVNDSTGDNDYWVETTTTSQTSIVAGVVWPVDIAAGTVGTIATRGVVDVNGDAVPAAGGPICSGGTAGKFSSCSDNTKSFGFTVSTASGGKTKCYINP